MSKPLPPPLPPAERTAGQVIAESIRLYGNRFWAALLLGLPIAAITQLSAGPLARGADGHPLDRVAVRHRRVRLGDRDRGACAPAARARSSARTSSGSSSSCRCPRCFASTCLPALAWLALFGLVRARRRVRAARLSERARARTPARRGGLRPRARLALRRVDRLLHHPRDARCFCCTVRRTPRSASRRSSPTSSSRRCCSSAPRSSTSIRPLAS